MTAPRPQPLVTLALFAYNQEKYIREAIESAFGQDYSPLEIILSDDCSSDTTFQIMKEMAEKFAGPHRVIVRQSVLNVGTARHVQEAFRASEGELFVLAAGDDVSMRTRVSELLQAWVRAGKPSGVVHSGWESFRDDDGVPPRQYPPKKSAIEDSPLAGFARSHWLPAAAPTVAYTRDVFDKFPPLLGGGIIEDAPLFLRAALIGKFVPCDKVLVRLRLHDNNAGTGYRIGTAGRWNQFMQSKLIAFRNMQSDLKKWDGDVDQALRVRIERRILGVLNSVPGLFLPETTNVGMARKVIVFVRMMFSPAVARTFSLRVAFALSFVGFDFHLSLKDWLKRSLGAVRQ